MNIFDMFDVVEEPGHSMEVIKEYEEKYGYSSEEVFEIGVSGDLDIPKKELRDWIHHYLIKRATS